VESGKFKKEKILGAGTLLDSARLNFWLEENFELPNGAANTLVLGEHGERLVICTHNSRIGNKLLSEFIIENKIEIQQLINSMQTAASLIKATQDATYYGIAASLVKIIEGILVPNPEKIFSLSVASSVKDGWNLGNVVISLPVKIASKGFKIEPAEKFSEEIRLEISNISEFLEQQWKNVQLKGNN
jgi:L-lactate dehydrogenase